MITWNNTCSKLLCDSSTYFHKKTICLHISIYWCGSLIGLHVWVVQLSIFWCCSLVCIECIVIRSHKLFYIENVAFMHDLWSSKVFTLYSNSLIKLPVYSNFVSHVFLACFDFSNHYLLFGIFYLPLHVSFTLWTLENAWKTHHWTQLVVP